MRTEDLIRAMANDPQRRSAPAGLALAQVLVPALAVVAALFVGTIGVRPGFAGMLAGDWRLLAKFAFLLPLAIVAARAVIRLADPVEEPSRLTPALVLGPLVLGLAVLAELASVPGAELAARAKGHNGFACLIAIPMLALLPLAATLYAARQGAPSYPAATGALAGLLAAGLGAALYATHCTDDSPLFVALWYPIGMAVIVGLGAVLGTRLLRW